MAMHKKEKIISDFLICLIAKCKMFVKKLTINNRRVWRFAGNCFLGQRQCFPRSTHPLPRPWKANIAMLSSLSLAPTIKDGSMWLTWTENVVINNNAVDLVVQYNIILLSIFLALSDWRLDCLSFFWGQICSQEFLFFLPLKERLKVCF